MILLPCLLFILWGELALCLTEKGGFEFNGDLRQFTVATNTVYIATEERLYQLNHDLTLIQSLTQRGVLKGQQGVDVQFHRVSDVEKWNTTLRVNVLLPFVENDTLISCGVIDNECGYCELLNLEDISSVFYSDLIQVGPLWRSSASVSFLVNVVKTSTNSETYILTATQQYEDKSIKSSCATISDAVTLHNTNNNQIGQMFSIRGVNGNWMINSKHGVEFVDGFQIDSIIYLFSNVRSNGKNSKVRLLWLEGTNNKRHTLQSLRGATLSLSDDSEGSRLVASSVISAGPPVLWSGVFSVDGGPTNTHLLLFDISPDLTGKSDEDPDFCTKSFCTDKSTTTKLLKPKTVLLRENDMTSVLAVSQKAWMVFFIGTGDGKLIKLAVDKNYRSACPSVLYNTNDDLKVFPKMHLDQVDLRHVYVPFQNQIKRVPVSKCSTYSNVQHCWSAQDPYCVWCSSKRSCTLEDGCEDSDWLSIPDDSQPKMVSHRVVKDSNGQIILTVQTHVTAGQRALSNFACHFSSGLCSENSPPPQFPQCTCILADSTLPAEDMAATVKIRLGTTQLSEELMLTNCADIRGPPTSVLCRRCVEAGCGWSANSCSWDTGGVMEESICETMESGMNFTRPVISSITPSVVSFYGRNNVVLSGYNLNDVTRVRIQALDCTRKESPVLSNTGVNLRFHIPKAEIRGEFKVCVVLPDGSCHGNAKITYSSVPSVTNMAPISSWVSGERKITLIGSHLNFVEGVTLTQNHAPLNFRIPTHSGFQSLTFDSPAAGYNGIFVSRLSLRVANESLFCPILMTYYPDPEFTSFTTMRTGDDVRITIQKKADQLNMTTAELSVWGTLDEQQYPCIMKDKFTNGKFDVFECVIQKLTSTVFQHLKIKFGGKTLTLGPPSLANQVILTLRILLIPFIIMALVIICLWQKKLTAEKDSH